MSCPRLIRRARLLAGSAGTAPVEKTATDLFTEGNNTTKVAASNAVGNVLFQPASTQAIRADGPTTAKLEENVLVLTVLTGRVRILTTKRWTIT